MNAPEHLTLLISRAVQMTPGQLFALEQAAAALLAEPADSKTPTVPAPPPDDDPVGPDGEAALRAAIFTPEPEDGDEPACGDFACSYCDEERGHV